MIYWQLYVNRCLQRYETMQADVSGSLNSADGIDSTRIWNLYFLKALQATAQAQFNGTLY